MTSLDIFDARSKNTLPEKHEKRFLKKRKKIGASFL